MAKKKKELYDDDMEENEEVNDDYDDDDLEFDDDDDENIPREGDDDDDYDEENLNEEEIQENEAEVEEIESKLASGEEFVASQSEVAMLLKTKIIYTCPRCRRIYFKNKWIKDNITDIYAVRTELAYCDKCLGKASENFVGNIEIYDKKLSENKNAFIKLAKKVEAELESREPFEIILNIFEKNEILYIFTNTTRLADEISKAFHQEWHGSMREREWFDRNQYLRAKWFSEVLNREYFKSRIRAAKEKRIGLFSFEDE